MYCLCQTFRCLSDAKLLQTQKILWEQNTVMQSGLSGRNCIHGCVAQIGRPTPSAFRLWLSGSLGSVPENRPVYPGEGRGEKKDLPVPDFNVTANSSVSSFDLNNPQPTWRCMNLMIRVNHVINCDHKTNKRIKTPPKVWVFFVSRERQTSAHFQHQVSGPSPVSQDDALVG